MQAAVLLHGGAPDVAHEDAALAAFGLIAERPSTEPFSLWPENVEAVTAFESMDTQWNVSPAGGVVGMRYEALPSVWEALDIPQSRRGEVLHALRVMERAARAHINGAI